MFTGPESCFWYRKRCTEAAASERHKAEACLVNRVVDLVFVWYCTNSGLQAELVTKQDQIRREQEVSFQMNVHMRVRILHELSLGLYQEACACSLHAVSGVRFVASHEFVRDCGTLPMVAFLDDLLAQRA